MGDGGAASARATRLRQHIAAGHAPLRPVADRATAGHGPVTVPPTPHAASPDQLSLLQRTAGNAAVARWLAPSAVQRRKRQSLKRRRGEADEGGASTDVNTAQRQAFVQRGGEEEESSPEEQFLNDLDSGAAKAKEYLEYIPTALEYWKKYGGDMPEGLKQAADNLEKISSTVIAGVDKFSDVVGKAKQALKIKQWAESALAVARNARDLDIQNKASRDALIKSVDKLGSQSKPFIDAANTWLKGLAIEGGLAASRGFIVLQGLTAYAELGWGALKAGLKNVEAYTGRFGYEGTEMDKVRQGEGSFVRPEEPDFPGNWQTAAEAEAEERATRRRMEEDARAIRRRERLAPYKAKVDEAQARIAAVTKVFEEKGFAKPYRRRRSKLVYQIAREMRYGKRKLGAYDYSRGEGWGSERGVGGRWYDALVKKESGEDEGDVISGRSVAPVKERITLEEAQYEIDTLRGVEPTCPFFNTIYLEELQKYSKKATAALKAANDEYNKAAAIKDK